MGYYIRSREELLAAEQERVLTPPVLQPCALQAKTFILAYERMQRQAAWVRA